MTAPAKAIRTELAHYLDNGPLAALALRPAASARLSWLLPPLMRTLEYGGLIALTLWVAPAALPACFALLAALAFHHYDTVYRLRHQRVAPPKWIGRIGGGWELRLAAAAVLAALGWLAPGMYAAAVLLGATYVAESVSSWWRFTKPSALYETEEDEQE